MEKINHLLKTIEKVAYDNTQFTQDVFVAVLGVVIGAFLTAYINNLAIRKKAKFDMQHEILKQYSQSVEVFCKSIEAIEITLATRKWKTGDLADDIFKLDTEMVHFANQIQEERWYVRKFIKSEYIKIYNTHVMTFHQIFFKFAPGTNSGFPMSIPYDEVSKEKVALLLQLERDMRDLNALFSEGLERLISPGIFSKMRRVFRKPITIVEECIGFFRADHYMKRKQRKRGK